MADKKTPAKKSSGKKTTATKRSTAKRSNASQPTTKVRVLRKMWSIFWKLSLAVVITMVLYLIYLDAKITRQFEGNKWQLPAQVYARAMSFYPGQFLSQQEVVWELNRLNYSSVNKLSRTGQYVKSANTIKVYRRDRKSVV